MVAVLIFPACGRLANGIATIAPPRWDSLAVTGPPFRDDLVAELGLQSGTPPSFEPTANASTSKEPDAKVDPKNAARVVVPFQRSDGEGEVLLKEPFQASLDTPAFPDVLALPQPDARPESGKRESSSLRLKALPPDEPLAAIPAERIPTEFRDVITQGAVATIHYWTLTVDIPSEATEIVKAFAEQFRNGAYRQVTLIMVPPLPDFARSTHEEAKRFGLRLAFSRSRAIKQALKEYGINPDSVLVAIADAPSSNASSEPGQNSDPAEELSSDRTLASVFVSDPNRVLSRSESEASTNEINPAGSAEFWFDY